MHKIILHATYTSQQPCLMPFTDGSKFKGEELYAEELTENTARIVTIPFSNHICSWGDIVEFQGKEIVKVLESTHRVLHFSHRDGDFNVITEYLQKHGIIAEVFVANYFGIAVPNEINDEELVSIVENCPIPLNVKENQDGP